MIEVYDSQNTNYNKNGDMVLTPLTCVLYAEINGEIKIELTHKYDKLGRWKYLLEENVIACPTPWGEKQLFRIYKKTKSLNKVTAYASHVFYDLRHKTLLDVRPTDKNGEEALNIILAGTGYTGHSNITLKTTAYYERKNIVAAIAGDIEQSFLNRWGGEILPDNFDIYIYDRIGKDRGVRVEFGHNMTQIEETIDMSNVITRIIPVGYNGIMLAGDEPWVDSPYINAYAQIYEKEVKYENIKVKESADATEGYETLEEAQAALKAAAEADFNNGVDKPAVNYVVNMALLENTAEYKNYKMLEVVQLGDTVTCRHRKIEIDVEARCISIEFDCIRKKTQKIELGEYVQTYFDAQNETNKEIKNATENTYTKEQVNQMINDYLEQVFKEGYVTEEALNKTLEEYATTKDVEEAVSSGTTGYITTAALKLMLKSYSTTEEMNQAINQALQGYSTTEQMQQAINDAVAGHITQEELNQALQGYSTTEQMQQAVNDAMAGYVTEEAYNLKIQELEGRLAQLGV